MVCGLNWSNLALFATPTFGRPSKKPKCCSMLPLEVRKYLFDIAQACDLLTE